MRCWVNNFCVRFKHQQALCWENRWRNPSVGICIRLFLHRVIGNQSWNQPGAVTEGRTCLSFSQILMATHVQSCTYTKVHGPVPTCAHQPPHDLCTPVYLHTLTVSPQRHKRNSQGCEYRPVCARHSLSLDRKGPQTTLGPSSLGSLWVPAAASSAAASPTQHPGQLCGGCITPNPPPQSAELCCEANPEPHNQGRSATKPSLNSCHAASHPRFLRHSELCRALLSAGPDQTHR